MMKCFAAALALAWPGLAHADVWIGAEVPFAFAASQAQRDLFEPGFLPAAGVYAGGHRAAVAARLRAGMLADGAAASGDGRVAPGAGGLVSTTLAGRVRLADAWVEAAAGGGLTGRTFAPTVELAVGWNFMSTSVELGPSIRYVRVISTNAMDAFGSADLVLVGIDVSLGKTPRPARARETLDEVVAMPRVEVAAPVVVERPAAVEPVALVADVDTLIETDASCVHDLVGCTPPPGMEVHADRIILDERVLFDLDRARVRRAGRKLVRTVVETWKANPTWLKITIEGHADVRGSDAYNVKLGELRARRVRDVMLELGAPQAIEVVGVGRARPRDPGHDDAAHARNRRVEFVIERSVP